VICLTVADLVLIAGRVLGRKTRGVLPLMDLDTAEAVLRQVEAEASGAAAPAGPAASAGPAATLLHGLVSRRVVAEGNRRVALAAALQFLALNGCDLELEPAGELRAMLAGVARGSVGAAELARWLEPRLLRQGASRRREEPAMAKFGKRDRRASGGGGFFQRFTDRARSVVKLAQEAARDLDHDYIGTEHLLLGLLMEGEGVAGRALAAVGVEQGAVRAQVEELVGRGSGARAGHIPFTPRSKKVLELALREALSLGHNYIGTEHILLGLIREGEGVAAKILARTTDFGHLRDAIKRELAGLVEVSDADEIMRLLSDRPSPLAEGLSRSQQRREQMIEDLTATFRGVFDDLERLQIENARLRELLRRHGIDPGDATTESA
jgi:Clp amino terminal domain, pathogenicity island component